MENSELLKRAEDLRARCERKCVVTNTNFLTPAERVEVKKWADFTRDCKIVFSGGHPDCERTMAFFLPEYMEPEDLDLSEYICAVELTAHFGEPGHRDYMGAILGMGIGREWLGDIAVDGTKATMFCAHSLKTHLLGIEKVGRVGVTTRELPLDAVVLPAKKTKKVSFSVMSMRLDAVAAGMFNLSRTEAARQIAAGNVSLNYIQTERTDAAIKEGDILSVKGCGKGTILGTGGTSRKGRLFVNAEIFI